MRLAGRRRWAAGVVALGLAGCGDEKTIPVGPTQADGPRQAPASLEGDRPAKEDPAARDIVMRAIAAHTGGKPERLDKLKSLHVLMTGKAHTPDPTNPEVDATWEVWAAWPDKYAARLDYKVAGSTPVAFVVTPTGGHMGMKPGPVQPLPPEELPSIRWDCFAADWAFGPLALTHPQAVYHSPGSVAVSGKTYPTVKAYIPGLPARTVRFDPDTHLLLRVDYVGLEANAAAPKSVEVGDYTDRDGVKVPGRLEVVVRGTPMWRVNVTTFEPGPIDPKRFETGP